MAAARKSGLGRGLDALLAVEKKETEAGSLPVDLIDPNPQQPRTRFSEKSLESLAASIREVGVLQPVVVGPAEDSGRYVLVAGERRLRAARMVGLEEIPAVIRESREEARLVEAVVENVQREDLGPIEEAEAYRRLMEDFGLKHDEVATRVGRSRSAVTNSVRLLNLPSEIQELLAEEQLSAGAGRALLALEDQAYALKVATDAVKEQWSVRQVEEAVRDRKDGGGSGKKKRRAEVTPTDRAAEIIALEERLAEALATSVKIDYGKRGGGKMTIKFGSLDDLERIYRGLLGK